MTARSGKTMSAVWAMRNVKESLSSTERLVLFAFFAFMNADGMAAPGTARLMRTTGLSRAAVQRSVDRLELEGVIVLELPYTAERAAVYSVKIDAIPDPGDQASPVVHPGQTSDDRGAYNGARPGIPGRPSEDLGEDPMRIGEEPSCAPPATQPSPVSLRPEQLTAHTMPEAQSPLQKSLPGFDRPESQPPTPKRQETPVATEQDPWGFGPEPRAKRTRKAKPTLTADALNIREREVHDAIVNDPTLSKICRDVPQLARDLVAAAGHTDVLAEVQKAGRWNRANPSKAWRSNGNSGLLKWIDRANQPQPAWARSEPAPVAAMPKVEPPRPAVSAAPPPPRVTSRTLDAPDFLAQMAAKDPQAARLIERVKK